jgi:hypothetical protein
MDWIRINIQPKMMDPDQMTTDPKHCFKGTLDVSDTQVLALLS